MRLQDQPAVGAVEGVRVIAQGVLETAPPRLPLGAADDQTCQRIREPNQGIQHIGQLIPGHHAAAVQAARALLGRDFGSVDEDPLTARTLLVGCKLVTGRRQGRRGRGAQQGTPTGQASVISLGSSKTSPRRRWNVCGVTPVLTVRVYHKENPRCDCGGRGHSLSSAEWATSPRLSWGPSKLAVRVRPRASLSSSRSKPADSEAGYWRATRAGRGPWLWPVVKVPGCKSRLWQPPSRAQQSPRAGGRMARLPRSGGRGRPRRPRERIDLSPVSSPVKSLACLWP